MFKVEKRDQHQNCWTVPLSLNNLKKRRALTLLFRGARKKKDKSVSLLQTNDLLGANAQKKQQHRCSCVATYSSYRVNWLLVPLHMVQIYTRTYGAIRADCLFEFYGATWVLPLVIGQGCAKGSVQTDNCSSCPAEAMQVSNAGRCA